jgi:hypothetical protein
VSGGVGRGGDFFCDEFGVDSRILMNLVSIRCKNKCLALKLDYKHGDGVLEGESKGGNQERIAIITKNVKKTEWIGVLWDRNEYDEKNMQYNVITQSN